MNEENKTASMDQGNGQAYEAPAVKVIKLEAAILGGGGGSGDNQAPGTGFD